MSGKKKAIVKSIRPSSRNEDAEAVCGAWAPRPGSVTDTPTALVVLGRSEGDEHGISVKEYNFDLDKLSNDVRGWSPGRLLVWEFDDVIG